MGNEKIHIIDQLFNQHFAEAEAPVRGAVWEGISAQMENSRLRKKVRFAWITAAASFLLLMGFGTWMFWGNEPAEQQFAQGYTIPTPQANTSGNTAANSVSSDSNANLQFNPNLAQHLGTFPRAGFRALTASPNDPQVTPDKSPKTNLSIFSVNQYGRPNRIGNTQPMEKATSLNTSVEDKAVFAELDAHAEEVPVVEEKNAVDAYDGAVGNGLQMTPELQHLESIMAQNRKKKPAMELSPLVDEMFGGNDTQADQPESPSFKRFSLGGAFSPDYAFATTAPVQEGNPSSRSFRLQDPADADQTNTDFVSAFSTGINFGYKVSQRVGLQSGVTYSNRTSNTTSELDAFGKTDSYNSSFTVSFVEVPLLVQYDLVSRDNFSYYVSSGMSASLLWDYDNTLSNPEGRVAARILSPEERKLQPTQANLLLRTGVRYNILDNLSLNIEPGIRYGVLSNKYAFANGNPLALSLSTGASFNF